MAIIKSRSLPLANYPNGTRDLGPFNLPAGLVNFAVNIGRCTTATPTIWPNASTILTLDFQFSYDNGATYTPLGANSWSQGGGIIVSHGVEKSETELMYRFSPDEPTHMKCRATVAGGPIRTYIDITLDDGT